MMAAAASAALAIAEIALIAGSSHAAGVSNYVPPLATVAGIVEDIRIVSDASDADGSIAYIEIRVADADATGAAYDICSIETYSWLIESGQKSRYSEVR